MQHRFVPALVVFGVLALVISGFAVNRVRAQTDVVADITARLTREGVSVKNVQLTSRVPFEVDIVVQSRGTASVVVADDPLFEQVIRHEIALAHQRYGIQPDSVNLTIVNASGATIYRAILPVREITPVATSAVDDTAAAKLVQAQLPLDGLHLTSVDVTTDANGSRVLTLHLSAQDIEAANLAIPQFMPDLFRFLDEQNSAQAMQITICNVYLVDSKGGLLLKYVRDIALAQENWWQADGLSQGWFTVPAPPSVQ